MLQHDLELYAKHEELQSEWDVFCLERNYLLSSFPAPRLDRSSIEWAGGWIPGRVPEVANLNLLSPLEVRESPLLVVMDDSNITSLSVSTQDMRDRFVYFPPINSDSQRQPIILRLRSRHYTVLRPTSCTLADVFSTVLPKLPPTNFHRHITRVPGECRIANVLSICQPLLEVDDLREFHDIALLHLSQQFPRTLSQSMAFQHQLSNDDCDAVDLLTTNTPPNKSTEPVRQLSPTSARERDACLSPDRDSPRKSAGVSSPAHANGLGRTARDPTGASRIFSQAMSSIQPTPLSSTPESLSTKTSQLSLNSELDLGAYVDQQCGRSDNAFAGRMRVYGDASTDETSDSGSLPPSSRSASLSLTPSLYSTGSLHSHLVPRGAEVPGCMRCRRSMGFFRFLEENHSCDNGECGKPFARNSYGWHCADCDVDLCSECWPYSWTPVDSFESSIPDSSNDGAAADAGSL